MAENQKKPFELPPKKWLITAIVLLLLAGALVIYALTRGEDPQETGDTTQPQVKPEEGKQEQVEAYVNLRLAFKETELEVRHLKEEVGSLIEEVRFGKSLDQQTIQGIFERLGAIQEETRNKQASQNDLSIALIQELWKERQRNLEDALQSLTKGQNDQEKKLQDLEKLAERILDDIQELKERDSEPPPHIKKVNSGNMFRDILTEPTDQDIRKDLEITHNSSGKSVVHSDVPVREVEPGAFIFFINGEWRAYHNEFSVRFVDPDTRKEHSKK